MFSSGNRNVSNLTREILHYMENPDKLLFGYKFEIIPS